MTMRDQLMSGDELGPIKVVQLYDPASGMKGIVVVDNVACGPAIGGVRMVPDVSVDEVRRLARAMTLKNAAAGLPHGGGKAGIAANPRDCDRPRLIRAFARAIRDLTEYIPGPDMGTDESSMAWIADEIGRAVGLPRVLGGIPLDEVGATGYGLARCALVAADFCDLKLDRARLAVEGFGNVGRHAARFLAERGVTLVAASDSGGTIVNPTGINVERLVEAKRQTGSVVGYDRGETRPLADLFRVDCEILIPAARPDCIYADNVSDIRARLILEGANIPVTREAETILHRRGVLVVPDFIANAGGVICAAVEYRGGSEANALEAIAEKIAANTLEVLRRSRADKVEPRQAAEQLATERVKEAMSYHRENRPLSSSPSQAVTRS